MEGFTGSGWEQGQLKMDNGWCQPLCKEGIVQQDDVHVSACMHISQLHSERLLKIEQVQMSRWILPEY